MQKARLLTAVAAAVTLLFPLDLTGTAHADEPPLKVYTTPVEPFSFAPFSFEKDGLYPRGQGRRRKAKVVGRLFEKREVRHRPATGAASTESGLTKCSFKLKEEGIRG
jgi:hypothetical protein